MSGFWSSSSNGLFGGFQRSSGSVPAAAWPSLIGAEMMVNGDCSSATGWSLGTGIAIAGGKMTAATAGTSAASNSGVDEGVFFTPATYRCDFTIDTRSAGSAQITMGDATGTSRTTTGTFSQDLSPTVSDGGWSISLATATMQLDSFSVKSIGLLGVEGDWTFTGAGTSWESVFPDGILFNAATTGEKAELTGAAKTSFDTSVSNSTACAVTITPDVNNPLDATISFSMKGGTAVNFAFDGLGTPITHTVTSGTGSGCIVTVVSAALSGKLIRIQCPLA